MIYSNISFLAYLIPRSRDISLLKRDLDLTIFYALYPFSTGKIEKLDF